MKTILIALVLILKGGGLVQAQLVSPQLIYDQQSATNNALGNFAQPVAFSGGQYIGQSFVPTLSAIDFVSFRFENVPRLVWPTTATVAVHLWSGGISNGLLLAITPPIFISLSPLGGGVVTNFFFDEPVALTPGATYYLQPFALSQTGNFGVELFSSPNASFPTGIRYADPYPAGSAVPNAFNIISQDLWFREGVVVTPEPSACGLILLAACLWFLFRFRLKRRSQTNILVGTNAPPP